MPTQRSTRRAWTDEEDSYLLTYVRPPFSYSFYQLGRDLDRPYSSVRARLIELRKHAANERRESAETLRAWMVSELAAHLTARGSIEVAQMATITTNLAVLKTQPKRYWQDRAARPLIDWFREVGAA